MISNRPIRAICTEVSRHGVTILKNDHLKKIISEKPLKTEGNIYINDITHPIINNDISKRKSLNIPDFSLTKLYKAKESQKKPMVNKIYKLI